MYVKDKVAFITGGASGLGFVHGKKLLENGAKGVTLADIDVVKGAEAIKEITEKYGPNKAIFVKLDVVNKKEFEDAINKTVKTFGNFDILINNAGIMNDAAWEKAIDINIKGLVHGCKLAIEEYFPKYKTPSSEPVIINISSIAGISPLFALPVYSGTKYAVIGISKSLSTQENYALHKTRILTLCPGGTETALIDGLENKGFSSQHGAMLISFINAHPEMLQGPEVVGDAMIKILEVGENGSIWVIDMNKLYQVEVPDQKDLKILKTL